MLTPRSGTENLGKLVRRNDFELLVSAVLRLLVVAPAQESCRMAESIALHMVVLHLAHAHSLHRLPRQILAGAPAAVAARHPFRRHCSVCLGKVGPFFPWMVSERVLAQWLELIGERFAPGHCER